MHRPGEPWCWVCEEKVVCWTTQHLHPSNGAPRYHHTGRGKKRSLGPVQTLYFIRAESNSNLGRRNWCRRRSLGPSCSRWISANPGLNFNLGFFFFCPEAFSRIIFSILFRASTYQIAGKKNTTEFAFKAFISELKFHFNPGMLWTTKPLGELNSKGAESAHFGKLDYKNLCIWFGFVKFGGGINAGPHSFAALYELNLWNSIQLMKVHCLNRALERFSYDLEKWFR